MQVVWDEVHFAGFVNGYLTGSYFFDIHPPLGKLALAASATLGGYDGKTSWATIGNPLPEESVPLLFLRGLPALQGTLTVPLVYLTARELGLSVPAALLSASGMLFDVCALVEVCCLPKQAHLGTSHHAMDIGFEADRFFDLWSLFSLLCRVREHLVCPKMTFSVTLLRSHATCSRTLRCYWRSYCRSQLELQSTSISAIEHKYDSMLLATAMKAQHITAPLVLALPARSPSPANPVCSRLRRRLAAAPHCGA
eukprot:2855730-Pleurochrysis_carterae.AAC.1